MAFLIWMAVERNIRDMNSGIELFTSIVRCAEYSTRAIGLTVKSHLYLPFFLRDLNNKQYFFLVHLINCLLVDFSISNTIYSYDFGFCFLWLFVSSHQVNVIWRQSHAAWFLCIFLAFSFHFGRLNKSNAGRWYRRQQLTNSIFHGFEMWCEYPDNESAACKPWMFRKKCQRIWYFFCCRCGLCNKLNWFAESRVLFVGHTHSKRSVVIEVVIIFRRSVNGDVFCLDLVNDLR